jgi:hypothetical protein
MDITLNEKKESAKASETGGIDLYRDSIKKALATAIGNAIEEETLRVTKELSDEREKAINMIAEERKAVIKKIVEDEKKSIWAKAFDAQKGDGGLNQEAIKDTIAQVMVETKPADSGKKAEVVPPVVNHATAAPAAAAPTANPALVTPAVPPVAVAPAAPVAHAPAAAVVPPVAAAAPAPAPSPAPRAPVYEEKMELEILPPRDQNEIESIHQYLKQLSEVASVDLITMVDKSMFKVTLNKPMDMMAKLGVLPQVHNAEEVREDGKKKIKISLAAKSKLERNHNEMNDKVNKIFSKKK